MGEGEWECERWWERYKTRFSREDLVFFCFGHDSADSARATQAALILSKIMNRVVAFIYI